MSSIDEINVDDRISMLPEEIITHILSLMYTADAMRTCILSKSWRYSWMSLDFLNIDVSRRPFVNLLQLIRGCPMLESLCLELCNWEEDEDYIFNIPTLEELELELSRKIASTSNVVVLNLPKLEYLYVGGELGEIFVMEDVSSLVKACVSFERVTSSHLLIKFLKGISGVESLSIYNYNIFTSCALPIFPNMKKLKFEHPWYTPHSELVFKFLERCPKLEHLHVKKIAGEHWVEPKPEHWVEAKHVPACMLTNLTTIKISKCDGKQAQLDFMKYMLRNAKMLKTVTFISNINDIKVEKQVCAWLLELPRASGFCKFHFIGKKSHFTTS